MSESPRQYKKPYERAIKKSVSMPGDLYVQADGKRRSERLPTFSDYVQDLIRRDLNTSKQVAA